MILKPKKTNDPLKKEIEKAKRKLKNVSAPSKLEQQEKTKYLEKEVLPKIREDIENLIKEIQNDLLSCNPIQTLETLSFLYSITTPDNLLEDIDSMKSAYLDYVHSLISSLKGYDLKGELNDAILTNIQKNIVELHNQIVFYFMIIGTDKDGTPDKTRFLQMLNHLVIRGLSYSNHQYSLCKELFSNYDQILQKKYFINAEELVDELKKIIESPEHNINIQGRYMVEMKKSHEQFIVDSKQAELDNRIEEFMLNYKDSEAIQDTNKRLQKIYDETAISCNDSIFKIHNISLTNELLDNISLQFGDNTSFKEGTIDYFPTNESLIYEKPLIKNDDEYFCFNPATLTHSLHMVLENLILNEIPENKRAKQYYKKKGDYLEGKSLKLFQEILPNSEIYQNLKYDIDDEVDGIVIYDNNILIVEAKSNKFTLEAKKGSLDRIKRNTKDIVDKAYQQAIRAKEYILSNEIIEFRDKNKNVVLKLDTTKINNIYLINTTLEPLMHITSNLNSLKEFGLIKGKDWIWSVYLNDLKIISEIIDSPTEFILYLERRIKFNDYPQIHSAEEIDIFGHFLSNGLYYDDIDFPKENYSMVTTGFCEEIDQYYFAKEGILDKKVSKPSFINKSPLKPLILKLEESKIDNFSIVSKLLLNYSGDDQNMIFEQVNYILNGRRKNFSMSINHNNIGFTFCHENYPNIEDMEFYCKIMSYDKKVNNWVLILIDGNHISNIDVSFKYFTFTNDFDEQLEQEVKELKERRMKQTLNVQKKIGRNDPCPCGSGKKYKKCCI